jgi:hypothetical protein
MTGASNGAAGLDRRGRGKAPGLHIDGGELRDNDRRNEPKRAHEKDDGAKAPGAGNGQISREK